MTALVAFASDGNIGWITLVGLVASLLTRRPWWARLQRWLMGTVLGLLAVRMAPTAAIKRATRASRS